MEYETWQIGPGIGVFLACVHAVAPEEWPALYARMSPARQARCDRYRREGDRRRCVLADALARTALASLSGVAPEAIALAATSRGKPYAPGLDLEFSLSHSGSLVLCAAAPFPVGADIQRVRPVSQTMTRRLARAGYEGGSEEEFFDWWTRQEAGDKLLGSGLALRPLPPGLDFWSARSDGPDGKYFYCVAWKKGAFPAL